MLCNLLNTSQMSQPTTVISAMPRNVGFRHRGGSHMPRKRPVEVRMAEMEMRMEDLKLEVAIKQLREKRASRRPRRRRRRV